MDIQMLTSFLGLCLLINAGILLLSFLSIMLFKSFAVRAHKAMFGLTEEQLSNRYFGYLAQFKLLVVVFNLTPYLALRSIA